MEAISQDLTQAIAEELHEHLEVMRMLSEKHVATVASIADTLVEALKRGGKILLMGNGGSAADAQHIAAELVGRFKAERQALPAIALTTDTSILTAMANDYGYEQVFARQVAALAKPGDVAVGITTSGNSPNVLRAMETARDRGCKTIGLTGRDGGQIVKVVDVCLIVPSQETSRIQEAHITIGHIVCGLIERSLCHGS